MPKEGFSINDLLYPRPREYQKDFDTKSIIRKKSLNGISEARKILKALELETLPIDLQPICEYLGAYIVEVDTIQENKKAAGRYLGDGRIEIKKGLPENLTRTTIAHELGHLALCHDTRLKWHEMDSYKDPDPYEKEAWDFAGEILIPKMLLKTKFKENPDPNNLAKVFNVSSIFLWIQLEKRKYF